MFRDLGPILRYLIVNHLQDILIDNLVLSTTAILPRPPHFLFEHRIYVFMSARYPSPTRSPEPVPAPATDSPSDDTPGAPARDVIRLLQCPRCARLLRSPVTLPCGRTVCRACLPEVRPRTNISYPGTLARLHGFRCFFPECDRDHAVGDCGNDVIANKVVAVAQQVLEQACRDNSATPEIQVLVAGALSPERLVQVATTGEGSSVGAGSVSHSVAGAGFLATYRLVDDGLLGYDEEIRFSAALEGMFNSQVDTLVANQMQALARQELDCQVCYALYYDPVTTPCGHTFCRHCLCRVLDYTTSCPFCRRALSLRTLINKESSPPNKLILTMAATLWPEALELRGQTILEDERGSQEGQIPVFVCTLSFPSMPTFLHVFEARYRLMIRRALEGDRTFGMVLYKRARSPADREFEELGTLLRIVSVEVRPDGRSLLETVGVSRFRIQSHSTLDGLRSSRDGGN